MKSISTPSTAPEEPAPAPVPATDVPAIETPATPTPPSTPASTLASWPEWFLALDIVLGMSALIIAFLAASYAVRNSDLWLQLASGRLIAQGNLHLGTDPFSFTGADRPWVHTTWLSDLCVYLVYSIDPSGVPLVATKAAIFTIVFALYYFLRRPGYSYWPWALFAIFAILACAPYSSLRPQVLSMLFLSITLVLIYRLPWKTNSWREPGIVAAVFALWANCDVWFILGPVLVLCITVGEYLNRFLLDDDAIKPDEPFAKAPPVPALVKTLMIGTVACLLNPYFLAAAVKSPGEAVAQLLPIELGFGIPAGATEDSEIASLTVSPLSADYLNSKVRGQSINGFAYAFLLLGGAMTMLLGIRNLRPTHIVLWIAFAALSLQHIRLIPFFAIVAVPLAASHWNALSDRFRLNSWSDPTTRILMTGTILVRFLSILGGFALISIAYPGWLHGISPNQAMQNRLDWTIEIAPALVRSTNQVVNLHTTGGLPTTVHGLNTSVEFGNYAAWFAPDHKVFVNSRFTFHREELPDLIAARQILVSSRAKREAIQSLNELANLSDKKKIGYYIIASGLQRVDESGLYDIVQKEDEWVLWQLDGRSSIFGRIPAGDPTLAAIVKRLEYDPVRVAFDPNQELLPPGKALKPPIRERELFDEYVYRPNLSPPEFDDAQTYAIYGEYKNFVSRRKWEDKLRLQFFLTAGLAGPSVFAFEPAPQETDNSQYAIPILMARAAHRGLAANPDPANGYQALMQVYSMPLAPALDVPVAVDLSERQLQILTAQVRYLDRMPSAASCTPYQNFIVAQVAANLFMTMMQSNQLDFGMVYFDRCISSWDRVPKEVQDEFLKTHQNKNVVALLKKPADFQVRPERQIRDVTERLQSARSKFEQFSMAQQFGLPKKAISIFFESSEDEKKSSQEHNAMLVQTIGLLLRSGQVEEVVGSWPELEKTMDEIATKDPNSPLLIALKQLEGLKCRLEGDYAGAEKALPKNPFPPVNWSPLDSKAELTVVGLSGLVGPSYLHMLATIDPQRPAPPVLGFVVAMHNKRAILQQESLYNYDRALLAINLGNMKDARYWLTQAAKPQGVDIREFGDRPQYARIAKYIELIDLAATPKK